jgi:hypothetical protein
MNAAGKWSRRNRQEGTTLIEVLVALMVATCFLGGLYLCVHQGLRLASDLAGRCEEMEARCLTPLLLVQWSSAAGQGVNGSEWEPVRAEGNWAEIKGDLEGDGGFPDGDLDDAFEAVRIGQEGQSLRIRSGSGSSQPFLLHVSHYAVRLASEALLEHEVRIGKPSQGLRERSYQINVFLPNLGQSLFESEGSTRCALP